MAELDVFEDFDLEALLQDFDGVPSLDLDDIYLFDLPSPSPEQPSLSPAESGSEVDSTSSWADELEKFLLESDDGGVEEPEVEEKFENNFFSDVLGSDGGKSEDGEKKGGVSRLGEGNSEGIEKKNGSSIVVDEDDDDSISKKRRRQMRNRDSALKSRERKKFYIKDLEMKSKYLESECRRIEYAFQCCVAENVALRQCLQNGRAFGAPVARQESAVLFVGFAIIHIRALLPAETRLPSLFQTKQIIPAAGFPVLARELHVPVPSTQLAQSRPKRSKQTRKRTRTGGPEGKK